MCRFILIRIALSCLFLLAMSLPSRAESPAELAVQAKRLLSEKCVRCHGAFRQEGKLRLDTVAAIQTGGEAGSAVKPNTPDDSLLMQRITTDDDALRMPHETEKLKLEQIDLLRRWIAAGAVAPADDVPQKDPRAHWAFQRPNRMAGNLRSQISDFKSQISDRNFEESNPIDVFIAVGHQAKGVTALPPASKNIWLRRLYIDLIGIPPTVDELRAFLADDSPDAERNLIERLLADPRYGERWGRHWMDVWRYSDWDGYGAEVRESKQHIWRWRDWIIDSLNDDKPYDRMIVEMLAGDELAPDDPDTLRATGFLARHWFRFNRNVWLDNVVEHTGKAFLGLTFNCAKCHDHMYDPLTQPEYFQLRAFFEPYDLRIDRLPGESDTEKAGLVRAFDANATAQTFLFVRGDEAQPIKDKPLPAELPALFQIKADAQPVSLSPSAAYPGLKSFIRDEALRAAQAEIARAETSLAQAKVTLSEDEKKLAASKSDSPAATDATKSDLPKNAVIADDFKVARPEVWNVTKGKFEPRDGRLVQTDSDSGNGTLVSKTPHPANFSASFRFKTTGGKMWKSVGLSFDAHDEANYHGVYLSCYAGSPKLQIAHHVAGQTSYPNDGALALPLELNRDYELTVSVREQLVNVSVNGAIALVYPIQSPRKTGGPLTLWTFDATAEFSRCIVTELAADAKLRDTPLTAVEQQMAVAAVKAAPTATDLASVVEAARDAVALAEKSDQAARANRKSVQARLDADAGSGPNAAAARAEKEHALIKAELAVLQADQAVAAAKKNLKPGDAKLQKAVIDAEANLTKQQQVREAATKAVEQPGESYTKFTEVFPATSTGRRFALAKWIASRDNPLTARVAVNHIWMRHFSSPLVSTVFDFGNNGKQPTHPELLDWLAIEFMESGWSMKHLHRLIVSSAAYRRASSEPLEINEIPLLTAYNKTRDPENLTLWRFTPKRLEAEAVRDATLVAGGSIENRLHGTELDQNLGLTSGRRSLYFRASKEKRMTFTSLFDGPNVSECYRRNETIAPQQALAMANSGLTLSQSRIIAAKLTDRAASESNNSDRSWLNTSPGRRVFVSLAFEHLLTRPPTEAELAECESFLTNQPQTFASENKPTAFKTASASQVAPSADANQRARENLIHVLLNHHEFVTVR